jgi:hypothetical protein
MSSQVFLDISCIRYRCTIHVHSWYWILYRYSLLSQFKQLQDQLLTKIEWLNSEFQHRMSTHELVMKHQLEMNELKFKMHLMEQQYNHRNISCQHDPYHRNICTPNVHFPGHSQPPPHPHIQPAKILNIFIY